MHVLNPSIHTCNINILIKGSNAIFQKIFEWYLLVADPTDSVLKTFSLENIDFCYQTGRSPVLVVTNQYIPERTATAGNNAISPKVWCHFWTHFPNFYCSFLLYYCDFSQISFQFCRPQSIKFYFLHSIIQQQN